MDKYSKLFCALMIALVGLGMTSCNPNSSNNDTRTIQYMQSCYARVTNIATNEVSYCTGMTFMIDLNWTQATGSFSMSGLVLDGKTQAVLGFEDIPFTINQSTYLTSFVTAGVNGGNPTMGITTGLSDVNIRWIDRVDLGQWLGNSSRYEPMFTFSFILDNKYKIVGSREPFLLFGATTSTAQADGSSYTTSDTYYTIDLDFEKMTAAITLTGARFVEAMPAQNMDFTDLPFEISETGIITIKSDTFIPQIAGTPMDMFPISNLYGVLNPATGMSLSFSCDVRKAAVYDVEAKLDYTSFR